MTTGVKEQNAIADYVATRRNFAKSFGGFVFFTIHNLYTDFHQNR